MQIKQSAIVKKNGKTYRTIYKNLASENINKSERIKRSEQKHTANSFFSLCRNVSTFKDIDSNKVVSTYEELIRKIKNLELIDTYIFILKNLEDKIINKKIDSSEALFIFINVFDPKLKLYTIVKDNKKKKEIINKVGFYSKDLVKAELIYYRALADLFEKDNSKTFK